MTVIILPFFWFLFPKSPTEAWFLTADEKRMMNLRYELDPSWGYSETFSWKECLKAFVDPKWYGFFCYQFSINISLYGLTTFMPAIVRGLGYSSVHANLMTVPIYICALAFFLVLAWWSDRSGVRGPFLLGGLLCLIIGYAVLISVDNLKVRFFACFSESTSHFYSSASGPLTPRSCCSWDIPDDRPVAHLASRQRGPALQACHDGWLYSYHRKYSWCSCGADLYRSNRSKVHHGPINRIGAGLFRCMYRHHHDAHNAVGEPKACSKNIGCRAGRYASRVRPYAGRLRRLFQVQHLIAYVGRRWWIARAPLDNYLFARIHVHQQLHTCIS